MYKLVSSLIIPVIILIIIGYGFYKKKDMYSSFLEGVKEGIDSGIKLFPYLLAIIFSTNILFHSNIIKDLLSFLKPLFLFQKIPFEIIPLAFMKSISGSASLGLTNQLFLEYGSDSFIGRIASVIQSSSETTIYIIALYFGYVGVKKIKNTLIISLIADFVGILVSILLVKWMFY